MWFIGAIIFGYLFITMLVVGVLQHQYWNFPLFLLLYTTMGLIAYFISAIDNKMGYKYQPKPSFWRMILLWYPGLFKPTLLCKMLEQENYIGTVYCGKYHMKYRNIINEIFKFDRKDNTLRCPICNLKRSYNGFPCGFRCEIYNGDDYIITQRCDPVAARAIARHFAQNLLRRPIPLGEGHSITPPHPQGDAVSCSRNL